MALVPEDDQEAATALHPRGDRTPPLPRTGEPLEQPQVSHLAQQGSDATLPHTSVGGQGFAGARPAPGVRATSKRMTAIGLGAPSPGAPLGAGYEPSAPPVFRTATNAPEIPSGSEADIADDSITRTAPVPAVPSSSPFDIDAYDSEDSITTRGLPIQDYDADSVTTRAPRSLQERQVSPADDERSSITSEVPPEHLSSMLLAIARGDSVPDGSNANQTAVMVNAPVKPPGAASFGSSDSALRSARVEPARGDQSSLGVLATSSAGRSAREPARGSSNPAHIESAKTGKKSRYGLVVGVVVVLSFLLPLSVFVWLRTRPVVDISPREKSELAPDPIGRVDPPRARAVAPAKPAPSSTHPPAGSGMRPRGGGSWRK